MIQLESTLISLGLLPIKMIQLEKPWFIANKEDVYVDTDSNYYNAEPLA
jgi:hypothetical protein